MRRKDDGKSPAFLAYISGTLKHNLFKPLPLIKIMVEENTSSKEEEEKNKSGEAEAEKKAEELEEAQ